MLESVGKYKIISIIARGGMGIVYKAEDTILRRVVAIKELSLIDADAERREEYRERFRREAILAANLNHKNVVSVFDVSITDEVAYYVMEFLRGTTLGQELHKRPDGKMTVEEFWPIFYQLCDGLSHAGSLNLVHRDIKPDNIFLLPDGLIKITDFGIAVSRDSNRTRLTKPGSFLGTLCYMSPEQLQDSTSVDQRADIYSLGAMSYEALSGEVPFPSDKGLHATMHAIITKNPVPLNLINPEISADLAGVIARAMRKKPEDRYSTAKEFLRDFQRAMMDPQGSKRKLQSHGSPLNPQSGQNTRPQDLRGAGQNVVEGAGLRQLVRGSAKYYSLTNTIPLVKNIANFPLGDARTGKSEPVAVFARKGKLVVADFATRGFKIFDANGKQEGESRCSDANRMGSKTNGGTFTKPSGLAIDLIGKIYATDAADQFVRVYDPKGWFAREFQNKQGSNGGISGILLDDKEGCVYISDPGKGCVNCVRSDLGTMMFDITTNNEGPLVYPSRMVMDGFGQLHILDQETGKVSVYTKNGVWQRTWGGKGTSKGAFNQPSGMSIDQADRIYVADAMNHRILVFSSAGDYLFVFGGQGSDPGKFNTPADLSVDYEANRLYVLDKGNRRVQVFEILMEDPK